MQGEGYIGALKPCMRNLNNKNNCYAIYKVYALHTLLIMIDKMYANAGSVSATYMNTVLPSLTIPFDCSSYKKIMLQCGTEVSCSYYLSEASDEEPPTLLVSLLTYVHQVAY